MLTETPMIDRLRGKERTSVLDNGNPANVQRNDFQFDMLVRTKNSLGEDRRL